MRKVRFSSEAFVYRDIDISRWQGVYVHPGDFKPAVANVAEDGEAWIRYRNRYRRLKAHRRLPRVERRKRPKRLLKYPDGHRRFRRS